MQKLTDLASRLKPYMMRWVDEAGGGAGGAPSPHDLDSVHHTGSLADTQATQFLKTDGTRTLTGNMAVSDLATIDGVDISAHDADAGAHHAQAHDLSGSDHIGTGLTVGYVIRATGVSTFAWAELQHGDLGGLGEDDHHVAFEELGADTGTATPEETNDRITIAGGVGLATTGATNTITVALDLSGAFTWAGDHLWDDGVGDSPTIGFVGGSNDDTAYIFLDDAATTGQSDLIIQLAGDTVQARLSVVNASLTLAAFEVGADGQFTHAGAGTITSLSTQLTLAYDGSNYAGLAVGATGGLTIQPTGDLELNPLSDDVLPTTNYEINLGSLSRKYLTIHAAELWVETLVAQDTIATIGGRILVGPTTVFEADLASGLTHGTQLVLNPGFETAGTGGVDVFANWTETASDGTITRDTDPVHEGTYSCELVAGAATATQVQGDNMTVTAQTDYELLFFSRGDGTYAGRYWIYDVSNSSYITATTATGVTAATWTLVADRFTTPVGCTSINVGFLCPATSGGTAHFDSCLLGEEIQITVKHNQAAAGDVAYSEANAKVEFFLITSAAGGSGPYTYSVRRDLDGSGANDWVSGDALFNTGAAGDGFMDLYSYSGITSGTVGPTIVGNVRASSVYNDWSESWAIGHLDGLYGQGSGVYGVGLGNYGGGTYILATDAGGIQIYGGSALKFQATSAGSLWVGDSATTERLSWDSTNGLQIYNSSNVAIIKFPISGAAQVIGTLTVTSPGEISAGDGAVILDETGINITYDTAYVAESAVNFKTSGGTIVSWLGGGWTSGNISTELVAAGIGSTDVVGVYMMAKGTGVSTWPKVTCYYDGSSGSKLIIHSHTSTFGSYVRVASGIRVGSITADPPNVGDIAYSGALSSYKGTTDYPVYAQAMYTTPKTSTSYDGDAITTGDKTIARSTWGWPSGAKYVLIRVLCSWSSASNSYYIGVRRTASDGFPCSCRSLAANILNEFQGWVEVYNDTSFILTIGGATTAATYLEIWGYAI